MDRGASIQRVSLRLRTRLIPAERWFPMYRPLTCLSLASPLHYYPTNKSGSTRINTLSYRNSICKRYGQRVQWTRQCGGLPLQTMSTQANHIPLSRLSQATRQLVMDPHRNVPDHRPSMAASMYHPAILTTRFRSSNAFRN